MEGNKPSHLFKVIVIGDSGVGKTNLITCFCENSFKESYVATIGVDFKIHTFMIGDKKIKMQILTPYKYFHNSVFYVAGITL